MNKQLLFLSLSATILLSSAMSVAASPTGTSERYSVKVVSVDQQDPLKTVVSIDVKDVSPTRFFAELKNKTGGKINFAYAVADLTEIKSITVRRNNITIGDLLREVLAPFKDLSFSVSSNTIVISKANRTETAEPQATMISGRVTDNQGAPVVGAVVRVKDTNNGCATDLDGRYVLAVPNGPQTIVVSMIGMETRAINYAGQKVLNISMKESINRVDDVVVTGMSQRSKESFTGGYVTVKGEQLKTLNPNNLLQALQFFDPSFKVVENESRGADPNARLKFQIRGDAVLGGLSEANTMDQLLDNVSSQPNEPLFVLDGFIVGLSRIMELDVERVESMTILKDAAACAIYGSRAANGVIVVTTKVAPEGKLSISYSNNISIQTPDLSDYNLMNAAEKLELEWKGGLYNQSSATSMNTYNDYLRSVLAGVNTYWLSQPLRTAVQNRHSLSIGGGTNLFRYSMGINASFSPGVMKGSSNNNKGINLNIQYNEEKWRLGLSVSVNDANGHNSPYGSFSDYTTINPYYQLTNEYGEYEQILDYKSLGSGYNRRIITNPLYNTQFQQKDMTNSLNLSNGLNLEYAPRQNLRFTLQMSYNRGVARQEKFLPANHTSFANEQDLTKRGSYSKNSGESTSWSSNLGYNYNLVKGKHLFSTFGNWTVNEDRNNYVTLSATGFPDEHMSDFILGYDMNMRPSGSEAMSRSMGFTEQLSYS